MGLKPRRTAIRALATQLTAEVRGAAAAQAAADLIETQRKALITATRNDAPLAQKKALRSQAELLKNQSQELYSLAKNFETRTSETPLPKPKRSRVSRKTNLSVVAVTLPRLLREHGGNASAIAAEMNTSRIQVHRWCKRFGYSLDDFRGAAYEPPKHAKSYDPAALKQTLTELLTKHEGQLRPIARELGRNRTTVRRWCARYDLDPDEFRGV